MLYEIRSFLDGDALDKAAALSPQLSAGYPKDAAVMIAIVRLAIKKERDHLLALRLLQTGLQQGGPKIPFLRFTYHCQLALEDLQGAQHTSVEILKLDPGDVSVKALMIDAFCADHNYAADLSAGQGTIIVPKWH